MRKVTAIAVPEGSLLAAFGGPDDYRDAFCREVPGAVSLEQFIERFYSSAAFGPERLVLRLLGRGAPKADISALAHGVADRIAVWELVERRESEILLESKDTGTASWLAVEPCEPGTRLMFGSWVGRLGQSGWRFMLRPHILYSRVLLRSARDSGAVGN